jgi:hypothetical protein
MPKKKQTVELQPGIVDEEDEDFTQEERDILSALTELEGGADAKWQVTRLAPTTDPINKPIGFCGELASSEVSLTEVQRRYGRGKYRVRGFKSAGGFVASKTFTIATDPPKEPVIPSHQSTEVVTMLERMNEREEKRAERSRELMMVAIPAAIAALPGVFQALFGNRQQTDPVTLLAGLKNLMPATPAAPDHSEFVFKMFDRLADIKDPHAKDEGIFGLVKDAVRELAPLAMEKLRAPNQSQLSQPALTVTPQPTQDQATGDQSMLKLLAWTKQTLQLLTTDAARDTDPVLCADWILAHVPEGVDIAKFAVYLRAANWWSVLQQFHSGVVPYQGWFHQFRDALLAGYEEMTEPPPGVSSGVNEMQSGTTEPVTTYFTDPEPPKAA